MLHAVDMDGNSRHINGDLSKLKEEQKIQVVPSALPQDVAAVKVEVETDIQEFWTRQIRSLSSAAEDTKSLLAQSLETSNTLINFCDQD